MKSTPEVADTDWEIRHPIPGDDLKGWSAHSGFLRMAAQVVQIGLGLGAGTVLARLLTPGDFGLFAMVASLTAFIGSFRDFGLPMATVHQRSIDHRQMSALFWINVKLNLVLALLMVAMAPILSWFYDEARLTAMTLVMAVGIFGLGLSAQHESLLMRQMRFGTLTVIEISALAAGILVGIGAAALGAGYWALVLQFLASLLTKSAATWLACDWSPDVVGARSRASTLDTRAILSYGRQTTASRVVAHIGRNLDRVMVGYVGGPTVLGLYDKSYQWSIFPTTQVHGPLLGVAVASLSRVRHDPERYRAYCRMGLLPVFSLCLPALAFMIVEARAVILLLLGEQWSAAVPLFRLFCIAAFVGCMAVVTKWLYLSWGETKRQLQWSLIATPMMIVAVMAGSRWGAYGVAVGFTVATCLLAYPSVAFCLKTLPLSTADFFGILWRPAVASIASAAVLLASPATLRFPENVVVALGLKLALFGVLYAVFWIGLPGGRGILGATVDFARQSTRAGTKRDSPDVP